MCLVVKFMSSALRHQKLYRGISLKMASASRQGALLNHLRSSVGFISSSFLKGDTSNKLTKATRSFYTKPCPVSALWTRSTHTWQAHGKSKLLQKRLCSISLLTQRNTFGATLNDSYQTGSSRVKSKGVVYEAVTDEPALKALRVQWENGHQQLYPYIWLRDNCRCDQCFHDTSSSRSFSFHSLDVEVQARSCTLSEQNDVMSVVWNDGHQSSYESSWLHQFQFDNSEPDLTLDPTLQHWDSDLLEKMAVFELKDILNDDNSLYCWIGELKEKGIALVKGDPGREGQVIEVGKRVAFIRQTEYGPSSQVKVKYDQAATNISYTTSTLPLHTDLVFQRPPGLLQCLEQTRSEGGENWLVDGFKVARDLKNKDPEAFEILSTTEVEFSDVGDDYYGKYHTKSRQTTITVDSQKRIRNIHISDHGRDSWLRIPVEKVYPFYRALKSFTNMLYNKNNIATYKMMDGDMITMDNRRVLHGRNGYKMTESGNRHIETAYIDWDELDSRFRVLHKQFGDSH